MLTSTYRHYKIDFQCCFGALSQTGSDNKDKLLVGYVPVYWFHSDVPWDKVHATIHDLQNNVS